MNLIKVQTHEKFAWLKFDRWESKSYSVDGCYINLDDVKYIYPIFKITNKEECETIDETKIPKIDILYYKVSFGHDCYIEITIDSYKKIEEYINKNRLEEKYSND